MDKNRNTNVVNFDRRKNYMNAIIEREPKTLECVVKMQNLARKAMKERGLTERDVKKALGIKR